MDRPFTVGTLLARSSDVWLRNLPVIAALTAVVHSPLVAWRLLVPERPGQVPAGTGEVGFSYDPLGLIPWAASPVLGYVLVGAVAYLVLQQLRGERASLGRTLAVAGKRLFAILATSLLGGLGTALGFLLLVLPGLIVMSATFVAVPVAVVERPGALVSLERSFDLTRGHRWHVLGAAILLWLLGRAALVAGELLLGRELASPGTVAYSLIGAFAGSVSSVASAVAYHDLRVAKEGVATADLVKVFE